MSIHGQRSMRLRFWLERVYGLRPVDGPNAHVDNGKVFFGRAAVCGHHTIRPSFLPWWRLALSPDGISISAPFRREFRLTRDQVRYVTTMHARPNVVVFELRSSRYASRAFEARRDVVWWFQRMGWVIDTTPQWFGGRIGGGRDFLARTDFETGWLRNKR